MARKVTNWSVKGIDEDVRDIARAAAGREEQTIGAWIDHAIRTHGQAHDQIHDRQGASGSAPENTSAYALTGTEGGMATGSVPAGPEALSGLLEEELEASSQRLDEALRPMSLALLDLARRMVEMERRVEERASQPDPGQPPPATGMEPAGERPGEGATAPQAVMPPAPGFDLGVGIDSLDLPMLAPEEDSASGRAHEIDRRLRALAGEVKRAESLSPAEPSPAPLADDLSPHQATGSFSDKQSPDNQSEVLKTGMVKTGEATSGQQKRGGVWRAGFAGILILLVVAGLYIFAGRPGFDLAERKALEIRDTALEVAQSWFARLDPGSVLSGFAFLAEPDLSGNEAAVISAPTKPEVAGAGEAPVTETSAGEAPFVEADEKPLVAESPPAAPAGDVPPVAPVSGPETATSPGARDIVPDISVDSGPEVPVVRTGEAVDEAAVPPSPPLPEGEAETHASGAGNVGAESRPALANEPSGQAADTGDSAAKRPVASDSAPAAPAPPAPAPPAPAPPAPVPPAPAPAPPAPRDSLPGIGRGDGPRGAEELRAAAIGGEAAAQYALARLYETGRGVQKDDVRTLLWYHSAAEQGHAGAQYNLGIMYAEGRGIPANFGEAARWFRAAAGQGVPEALYNLAVMTEEGFGIAQDREAALELYRAAARAGETRAEAVLAAGNGPVSGSARAAFPGPPLSASGAASGDTPRPGGEASAVLTGAIQRELQRLGLYDGNIDGLAGAGTREAIRGFQQAQGLAVDGSASRELLELLRAARP